VKILILNNKDVMEQSLFALVTTDRGFYRPTPAWGQRRKSEPIGWMSALAPKAEIADDRRHVREVPIVLQNSKNGLQRFFREKSNQATIADRFVLKRATEVAGEFIASC
jgi:hypothetical protein